MHEIFDEIEPEREARAPRPDPRQRGRGRGSGPKRGRGALIALLLTFLVVAGFVITQRGGTGQPTAAPSPSLAAPQGALDASSSARSAGRVAVGNKSIHVGCESERGRSTPERESVRGADCRTGTTEPRPFQP